MIKHGIKKNKNGMTILSELYNKEYTDKIVSKKWRYKNIPKIVEVLWNFFGKPSSILDIGCANGLHCKSFIELGCIAVGIEGTHHFKEYAIENCSEFYIFDLRRKFNLERNFDLIHCVEVLEHIESEWDDIAIENICKHGNLLCISANPDKGGYNHINCQPKRYWIKKFKDNGFKYNGNLTRDIQKEMEKIDAPLWYKEHMMIFERI